jgi:predicted transcriptional regulator
MANTSLLTQKQIGGYFGVTQAMVSYIKNLKRRQSV